MAGTIFFCLLSFVLYHLVNLAWRFARYTHPVIKYFSKRRELKNAGEWAVITGSTDGIGKAFAEELATDGLNIFLISRTAEKLNRVARDIERDYKVQTKVFVADFDKGDFYEALKREIDSLSSVACLINNVGMSQVCSGAMATCEFLNIEFVQHMISCNVISTACMTRITLPKMLHSRIGGTKHPPCVINMSSVSAIYPRPYKSLYAACKSFVKSFSESVAVEMHANSTNRVRFLTLTPGFIWTPRRGEKRLNFFKPSPEVFVKSALNMIGVTSECCGFMPHELMVLGLGVLPGFLRDFIVAQFELRQRQKFLTRSKEK